MNAHGNIVLIGFMGTGKSETGRILASCLDMEFLDTDAEIEARSGKAIPELFTELGESGFRAIEKEVVNGLKDVQCHVISTGGGAVTDPENMMVFGELGTTVHLTATPETILKRTNGDAGARPMLAGTDGLERVNELLASRSNQYAKADFSVDTTERDPFDVATQVIDRIDQESTRIRVDLGAQSYDILIGVSITSRLGMLLREFDVTPRVLIVTNPGVGELYGTAVERSLGAAGFESSTIIIPDGESHKTLEWASHIYDAMLDHRMDRKSAVIALGGGVIGDL
ncbi:MAG: 3-dehydroquinate synthase, partial [Candidatus Latescibacteria bacterium]|nr:3-dehydroquinate synthase [Candidatus Latescibacterota bacterium]